MGKRYRRDSWFCAECSARHLRNHSIGFVQWMYRAEIIGRVQTCSEECCMAFRVRYGLMQGRAMPYYLARTGCQHYIVTTLRLEVLRG